MDLGQVEDVRDCAQKCCDHLSCEVAQVTRRKCFAFACYTKELCRSVPFSGNSTTESTLIYINKRNSLRQKDKGVWN